MTQKCPICQEKTDRTVRPFCSRTCKNIDLNRWLSNRYVLKPQFFEKEVVQDFSEKPASEEKG